MFECWTRHGILVGNIFQECKIDASQSQFIGLEQMQAAHQLAMDFIDEDEFFITGIDDDRRRM
jgi:hypothetical protein